MRGVRFTWDDDKAAEVDSHHHIDFARITDIFNDPYAVEFIDETHSTETETRYVIIGLTGYRIGLPGLYGTDARRGAFHYSKMSRTVDGR
jgi:uncharacterized DUF497 family protein